VFPLWQVRALCLSGQWKSEIPQTPSACLPFLRSSARSAHRLSGKAEKSCRAMSASTQPVSKKSHRWPLTAIIHIVLAVPLLAWSGFFTLDFLLSGVYTFPRTSRAITLTLAVIILSYEFIYKEHLTRYSSSTGIPPQKIVLYSCIIPYMVGSLALLSLVFFS